VHCYIGEEAVAVGVCAALDGDDQIISTHRGHGHCIAKGADLKRMMAELYGRQTGYCKGKGGSMHIADASVGYLGANGVLTSGCVLAPGVGQSIQMRGTDQVAVTVFGDGAANRGPFHEGVNLAALWKVPVVFVCENNFWASTTAHDLSTAGGSIAARAAGYGIPGVTVDGNDVLAVYDAMEGAVTRARAGQGPSLVEARTVRFLGHFEGDPQGYRSRGEVEAGRQRDPIARLRAHLEDTRLLDESDAARVAAAVELEIQDAVDFAESSPLPAPEDALQDLFVHYPWRD
jgi:pyruvate dehydrogenase E1 component alpha subunit